MRGKRDLVPFGEPACEQLDRLRFLGSVGDLEPRFVLAVEEQGGFWLAKRNAVHRARDERRDVPLSAPARRGARLGGLAAELGVERQLLCRQRTHRYPVVPLRPPAPQHEEPAEDREDDNRDDTGSDNRYQHSQEVQRVRRAVAASRTERLGVQGAVVALGVVVDARVGRQTPRAFLRDFTAFLFGGIKLTFYLALISPSAVHPLTPLTSISATIARNAAFILET